jgi:decaprenyl-phosphate phosphoribosyltransferase
MKLLAYIREARPRQWTKNLLVLAAPGAAGHLTDGTTLGRAALMFAAFCLVSSGTYYVNDIRDVEQDRLHPRKKSRPIASGEIGLRNAAIVAVMLMFSGFLVALSTAPPAAAILALYGGLTLVYSMGLKNTALLDLAIVASGFVLRAVAGAVATSTPMSDWFILCTMFGSFFIVTGKRLAESREMGEAAGSTRRTLLVYPDGYLAQLLTLACGATLLTYCLWALENSDGAESVIPLHVVSIVPMSLALFRYMMVIHAGGGSAPEDVLLSDRAMQLYALGWLGVYTGAVYAG